MPSFPVHTRRGNTLRALAAACAVGVVLGTAGCGSSGHQTSAVSNVISGQHSPVGGDLMNPPYPKPPLTLTDTSGHRYDFDHETNGRLTLLYFGYTHCPDVCPTTMATLAAALRKLPAAQRKKISVVFVSTDPHRDTPKVLRTWLHQFDPSFVGLTGQFAKVRKAAAALHIDIAPR